MIKMIEIDTYSSDLTGEAVEVLGSDLSPFSFGFSDPDSLTGEALTAVHSLVLEVTSTSFAEDTSAIVTF